MPNKDAHRTKILIALAALVLLVGLTPAAWAADVYDREIFTTGAKTGSARWTNDYQYAAIKIVRLSAVKSANATNIVTFTRIIPISTTLTATQTVGAVTCASGAGTQATVAYNYLKPGEIVALSSLVATNATAILEFEVQRP